MARANPAKGIGAIFLGEREMRSSLVTGAVLAWILGASAASAFDNRTPCLTVIAIMNADPADKAQTELTAYLSGAIDARHRANRSPFMMTDGQKTTLYLAVNGYCRDEPGRTLGEVLDQAYNGVAVLHRILKEDQDLGGQ